MSWNYRVLRTKVTWEETFSDITSDGFYYEYELRGVYYDGAGNIEGVAGEPPSPFGNSVAELTEDLELFKLALRKPVLELVDGNYVEVVNNE